MTLYNPLTSRLMNNGRCVLKRDSSAEVPNQNPTPSRTMFGEDDGLHTPHQDVPMMPPTTMSPEHFQRQSPKDWNCGGFRWKDMSRGRMGQWRKEDEMFFDPEHPTEMALGFSREDIEYTKISKKKNKEIINNMSERQKRMLKALESGKIFKLTKLKEENR